MHGGNTTNEQHGHTLAWMRARTAKVLWADLADLDAPHIAT